MNRLRRVQIRTFEETGYILQTFQLPCWAKKRTKQSDESTKSQTSCALKKDCL